MNNVTNDRFIELMNGDSGEWVGDNAYLGLQILSKYTKKLIQWTKPSMIGSEEIDILIENGITEEDILELRRLNWMIEGGEYLACFV